MKKLTIIYNDGVKNVINQNQIVNYIINEHWLQINLSNNKNGNIYIIDKFIQEIFEKNIFETNITLEIQRGCVECKDDKCEFIKLF